MTRKDNNTFNLFEYKPPEIVKKFKDDERVRAASLSGKVCRSLAEALRLEGKPREGVAAELSEYLGEVISKDLLDAYTSEARDKNNIPAYRFIALIEILDRPELLNELLSGSNYMVVDRKYEPLINRELKSEILEKLSREIKSHDAEWKGVR